jgi:hypothetical protein
MLATWASRLDALRHDNVVYLPYSIDDEFIEAFEAATDGAGLSLTVVKLDSLGYVPGVDSLLEEILTRQPVVVERRAERFLVCDQPQLKMAAELASTQVRSGSAA